MSKTHRCIDCPQEVEHDEDELCPSCGRCPSHCHGGKQDKTHAPMKTRSS